MKKVIVILVLIGVVFVVTFVVFRLHTSSYIPNKLDAFAKCLTEKGAVMYGTDYCEWCQKQKADFGSAWQFVNYANCVSDPQKCTAQNIQSTPTWIFSDGERLIGYQTLENLSKQSSCPLPSVSK